MHACMCRNAILLWGTMSLPRTSAKSINQYILAYEKDYAQQDVVHQISPGCICFLWQPDLVRCMTHTFQGNNVIDFPCSCKYSHHSHSWVWLGIHMPGVCLWTGFVLDEGDPISHVWCLERGLRLLVYCGHSGCFSVGHYRVPAACSNQDVAAGLALACVLLVLQLSNSNWCQRFFSNLISTTKLTSFHVVTWLENHCNLSDKSFWRVIGQSSAPVSLEYVK